MKMMNKVCALVLSVALCAGMAAPAFAYDGEPVEEVEQPVLTSTTDEEDVVTVTDEETGALTPEGNLTLVDDYHTNYSDGSGQQFITLVSKSGATFYLVIDRNAKGQQTVHFMNLVDEADLLALMEEDAADAYTAEKEAAAQAEQDKLKAEEEAKKAAEEAAASGTEQPRANMRDLNLLNQAWPNAVFGLRPRLFFLLIPYIYIFVLHRRFYERERPYHLRASDLRGNGTDPGNDPVHPHALRCLPL